MERNYISESIYVLDDGPWALDQVSGFWVTLDGRIARPGFLLTRIDGKIKWFKPKWVNPSYIHPAGYVYARDSYKNHYWHRVIARAWIPNPDNKREVHHIDHNPRNNSLNNLQWVTHAENNQASWDTQTRKRPQHDKNGRFTWK